MEANELWKKRQSIMMFEDQQELAKSELDQYKNYVLGNDELLHDLIKEHNEIASDFEKKVEEATRHLNEKLEEIANRKKEIKAYSNYILLNDNLLSELTTDYNSIKNKWKTSITEFSVSVDKFVDSGETKDV